MGGTFAANSLEYVLTNSWWSGVVGPLTFLAAPFCFIYADTKFRGLLLAAIISLCVLMGGNPVFASIPLFVSICVFFQYEKEPLNLKDSFHISRPSTIILLLSFVLLGIFCAFSTIYISSQDGFIIDNTGIDGVDSGRFLLGPYMLLFPFIWGWLSDSRGVMFSFIGVLMTCQLSILVESYPLLLAGLTGLATCVPLLIYTIYGRKMFPYMYAILQLVGFAFYYAADALYTYDFALWTPLIILGAAALIYSAWKNRFTVV